MGVKDDVLTRVSAMPSLVSERVSTRGAHVYLFQLEPRADMLPRHQAETIAIGCRRRPKGPAWYAWAHYYGNRLEAEADDPETALTSVLAQANAKARSTGWDEEEVTAPEVCTRCGRAIGTPWGLGEAYCEHCDGD